MKKSIYFKVDRYTHVVLQKNTVQYMVHKNMGKILIAHFTDKTVDSIIRCYCKNGVVVVVIGK